MVGRIQGPIKNYITAGTSLPVTLPAAPVAGNTLIAVIGTRRSAISTVVSIAQTGVTWTYKVSSSGTYGGTVINSEIWLGVVGAGATNAITITLSAAIVLCAVADIMEYGGSFTLDRTVASNGSGTTLNTGTTLTTIYANELWIGAGTALVGSNRNPTNGFTELDGFLTASVIGVCCMEKIVTSTGTASCQETLSSGGYAACLITLYQSSVLHFQQEGMDFQESKFRGY